MLGSTFYHQTIRKYVAAFGTLFNDLKVERKNSAGAVVERVGVPLAYGPRQKWLLALRESINSIHLEEILLQIRLQELPL